MDSAEHQSPALTPGEAPPLLRLASNRNPQFAFGALGGRYVLVCVVVDFASSAASSALQTVASSATRRVDRGVALFCAGDPCEHTALVAEIGKTKLVFADPGAARTMRLVGAGAPAEGQWMLFDPSLRLLATWPLAETQAALSTFDQLPDANDHAGVPLSAPVLIAPRIFEPAFCETLIRYYERTGAAPSGVTRESTSGTTYVELDADFKRRTDCLIADETLRKTAMHRVFWRLLPEIEKAFMWRATRMERYLVARYDADGGGFFRPHRDNTTKGTAHRRFAVTINLNTGAYEGGDLRFPEFGSRTYCAPLGGAVVFSCSLLHEATPVTKGARFAFLPFLYDEEAAQVRAKNNPHLAEDLPQYRAD
jgi:hypothetical protein